MKKALILLGGALLLILVGANLNGEPVKTLPEVIMHFSHSRSDTFKVHGTVVISKSRERSSDSKDWNRRIVTILYAAEGVPQDWRGLGTDLEDGGFALITRTIANGSRMPIPILSSREGRSIVLDTREDSAFFDYIASADELTISEAKLDANGYQVPPN